ncbi:RteC domain-containing protein [Winogradskyella maritima]|uniref:RteC domain-containing protein n=1 Tax=Winogradskyella maritima TaxID=1517766 RepID=A0ABV8AIL8_9FLAO|nr:RteC domain-containing protein [Winogradskyella maritima]
MNVHTISTHFLNALKRIQSEDTSLVQRAIKAIRASRASLAKLRNEVITKGFANIDEEVLFFKVTKQLPLVQLIYYSEIQNFQCSFNENSLSLRRDGIKKQFCKYDDFFLRNLDFGQYIELGSTHFDEFYFTRKLLDKMPNTSSPYYLQDTEFNTPKDFLLAQFTAYGLMVSFLRKKQKQLDMESDSLKLKGNFDLKCTSSKIDIVELIYALHASKAVLGDIKELVRAFEIIFNIDLGDFYRTFVDIRNRSNDPSKFLDILKTSLLQRISELDN